MSSDTDMTIQLFMQATILLSNYYGYSTIRYSELRDRSNRAGFEMIPFMPPETIRATPELVSFFNGYENNGPALEAALRTYGGYKVLVKYYIRTGLRASQAICRNYLLNLEEKNEYYEYLQKEIGVAAAVSTSVLALVDANATLTKSFMIARTGVDGAIDAYRDYRFLNIDREAARALVEAAQNALAQHYLKQVDSGSPMSNLTTGGYTFSDALNAVSMIEYQCTRSGIRSLLTRSINNSPSNLVVDEATGTLVFRSTIKATVVNDTPPSATPVGAPPPIATGPASPGGGVATGGGTSGVAAGTNSSGNHHGGGTQTHSGTTPAVACPASTTRDDAKNVVTSKQQIIARVQPTLDNPSAPGFQAKTAADIGNQVVAALTCVNSQLEVGSESSEAAAKDEFGKLQGRITNRIAAIQKIVGKVSDAPKPLDKQTVVDTATQLNVQIKGATGLEGANDLVKRSLTLLGG